MSARRSIAVLLACAACAASLPARALAPLDDASLSSYVGGDGVSIAVHLNLNYPNATDPVVNSTLTVGFDVGGQTNYAVLLNPHGVLDLFSFTFDTVQRGDGGGDVLVIGLPTFVGFQNFGFDALGIQSDPTAPISGDLGHVILNGTLSMQGQLRVWGRQ